MGITGIISYLVSFLIQAGIYAVFTLGLNIQWGFTGLFNIGIAGFFAIGAYTSALFTLPMPSGVHVHYVQQALGLGLPVICGVLAAAIVCGIVAFLVGFPTLRLREDYLAIATIGIAETIRLVFNNERWLANGPQPLTGLPQPFWHALVDSGLISSKNYAYIYLAIVLVVMILIYLIIEQIIRSPWGRVLRAIREDEPATQMSGKDIFRFKMQALILGAMIMGIGGALWAHYIRSVDPSMFTPLFATFIMWVMLMLGGSGNNKGAILGAFVVWGIWVGTSFITAELPPALQSRAPYLRLLLIGVLLELVLLFRPQGILGEVRRVSRMLKE
ncbi:MAG: branched-chain amino acid ABC transporter permease [Candidatus Bipolaricaulia bacterium]